MLTPLGFFLLTLLAMCTLLLLICWFLDANRTGIAAGRDRPVILAFPVYPHSGRSHFRRPVPRYPERFGARGRYDRSHRGDQAC
jgi:hypothetical protein